MDTECCFRNEMMNDIPFRIVIDFNVSEIEHARKNTVKGLTLALASPNSAMELS